MAPGNELVLRGVLEAGKVVRPVGPIVTIGRDEASSIVLADGSTSLAHAEIAIIDGRAILRDVGSDTGTFYGKIEEESVGQLAENESVMLGEGDRVSFGPGEAELYRVEQAPDGTLSKVDVGPPPQLQAGSTTTVDHNDDDNSEDGEGDENNHQEDEQLADGSVDEMERSSGERYTVIVTVSRAEGLSGVASSSVFRRPKNKRTYVRVTMTDNREGGEQRFTADTSSVTGSGSKCSWGEKGSTGEAVSLQVDKDVLDSMDRTSSERVTEGTAAFELEVWSETSEGGGEDVLLGRGQADLTFVDSKPRWVMLDPKGKVEISITTGLHESDGGEQDAHDRKSLSAQDGLTSALGSDHEQKGDSNITEDTPKEALPDNAPKTSSPKWGLPRMPDLKDTLSVGLGRAAKLRGKQRAQTSGDEAIEEAVAINSPAEDASQPADEVEDGGERQVTIDNAPSDPHETQGKKASRVAIRGMQSIKENLQARLLGTSGKLSTGHEHAQNEKAAAELHEDDGARGLPPASREGTLSARSSASSNTAIEHDEAGPFETIIQQDKVQKKRMSRDEEGSKSPTEDGGHAERGRSSHLRSLLQDAPAGDQGVRQSEDDKQDENDGTDGDQTARRDTVGEETRESQAKGPVAQVVSALDAISAKAAAVSASRFKSTLSSPGLTSTLKGFGWNRAKEEPVAGALSSLSDASCEPVQTFSSDTPAGANEASEPAIIQRKGSFEPSSPSLEATTLLVTILQASGLPEVLAKGKFAWANKNATQDPVVRLSTCDVFGSSSVVRGGGRECRWGTKMEGDIVELPIPSSDVPAEGLGALKLAVEVYDKASDEAENDILLGRAEILVGDWLGKKAKWAALDAKRSQGGRVKLNLALKGSGKVGGVHRSSDASDDIVENSSGDGPDNGVDDAGLTTPHPDATSALADGIVDIVQQTEEAPIQSEAEANDLGLVVQHDGEASETTHAEGSNEGVLPLAQGPVSDGHQQQATLAEDDSSHVSTSVVEKKLEAQTKEVENPNESVGSNKDGSLSSDTTKKEEGKEVGISILVIEADALHTRVSGNDGGAPNSDPYIVLHVCGETHATSAVIEGGAKCRWPGTGEEISFKTSYDALTAVGWGREEAVGPFLTVEVYNQDSSTREADVFIGSANVMLKEYLGVGPKWVDVHRRRKGRGRVLIDAKSPELQQDMPTTGHTGNPDTIGPGHADEEQVPEAVAVASGERRKSSSGVPEESGPERDSREDSEANGKGNSLSNLGSDPGKYQSTDPPRSTASDGSSAGSLGEVRQKQERTSSGADLNAAGSVDTVGSHILELSRQQSQASALLTPHGDEGEIAGSADESATAEGADGGLVQDDENELEPFEARETPPGAGPMTESNSCGLAHRVAGGTAKALDLTAAACSSDQREASIAEEQRAEIDTVITTVEPKVCLEIDNSQSSRQENDSSCQASVPVAYEKNATSQQHPKERQRSSDLHAGGAPKVDTKDETSNGRPETPNEVVEALDTQPRERARTPRADPRRIKRAREIIRRRRTMVSNMGHASPGLRVASGLGTSTVEKAQAATTIQGAFRGRIARRRLRVCQRAVVKIQAAYRGHVDRKGFVALSARSKRAKAEEQRARARRSRIAVTTQELNLLRSTPAQQLLRVDALHAEASACRIQRLWRRTRGIKGVSQLDEDCARDKARVGSIETRIHAVTAPEIFSRSDRISVSGMSLEALRLRVANRQRAKERSRDGGQDAVFPLSTCERLSGTERKPKAGGTVDATYKTLLQWQEKASQLSAAFYHSGSGRLAAAKRRRERLAKFKITQEQLLHPPKLFRPDKAELSAGHFENTASEDSRRRHILKIAADKSWAEAEEPAQRDRAQRAHALAVAAANARGKKSWATSLPPDVGYDELVDIRTVVVPWPPTSVGRRGELDFVDGFVRRRSDSSGERGSRVSNREFDSDEASLWWYAYARTEGAHTTGLPREDRVYAELLERVKTTPTRRKEQAEREGQLYQLRVARQKQIAIDKVVHRHLVANCPKISHARRRVTAAQRCAAVNIQAYIRGFLERKHTAVLRAEMRVFGALQVLVNELRQPELEAGDNTNSLAVILAEHVNGQSRVGEHSTGRRNRLPRVPDRGPATILAAGSSD